MILDAFDIGGTETYVLSITRELLKHGISVFVAGKDGSLRNEFDLPDCEIFNDVNDEIEFENWIKKHQINVIHAHLESSAKQAIKLSNKLGIPMIYTIHGTYYDRLKLRKMIDGCKIKPIMISVSLPVQKWLRKEDISSILIPNGIDTREFKYIKIKNLRNELGIPEKSLVVLYASRLEDEKYKICKLLLQGTKDDLLKKIPNLHLIVAGDGKRANRIQKWIREKSKSDRIHYVGKCLDMSALYSISDCVIGSGRVALEAMACQRTVVAIGSAGMFDIVTPSKFGKAWKYYFGDHKSIRPFNQKVIVSLVKTTLRSRDKWKKWGKAGRLFIKKYFKIDKVVEQLLEIYESHV